MSSGWGCQYMGRYESYDNWCMKLSHVCNPGCKGCIIYGKVEFSKPDISPEQEQKRKNRSDNPLGKR
ncbi:MAG: hypothetical protein IE885_04625 [Campylobacterales bacterium]|nr:hypothetical protein [Campylobacterales bacterium]